MLQNKNIAIIAYDINPYGESESLISWKFVIGALNNGANVFLITKKEHKVNLDKYFCQFTSDNIRIFYCDCATKNRLYKFLPYFLLAKKVVKIFKKETNNFLNKISESVDIDIIHRVTPNSIRLLIDLSKFEKPIKILGPCGGFQETPKKLLKYLSFKERLIELCHLVINKLHQHSKAYKRVINSYDYLYLCNQETYNIVRSLLKEPNKAKLLPDVGVDLAKVGYRKKSENSSMKILYAGRYIYRKGVLFIPKIAYMLRNENIQFTLIGTGNYTNKIYKLIKKYGVQDMFRIIGWIHKDEINVYYDSSDCFLFPSLRESGGSVLAECVEHNLPVICFETGANRNILKGNGIYINDYKNVFEEFKEKILELKNNTITIEESDFNDLTREYKIRTIYKL